MNRLLDTSTLIIEKLVRIAHPSCCLKLHISRREKYDSGSMLLEENSVAVVDSISVVLLPFMASENHHLTAYQSLFPTASKKSAKSNARYFLSDSYRPVCWACLGEHESIHCSQKRCYRCAKAGHESSQCRSTEFCDYCTSSGHSVASKCYQRVYEAGLDPRQHSNIQCLSCGEIGHMNCTAAKERGSDWQRKRPRS